MNRIIVGILVAALAGASILQLVKLKSISNSQLEQARKLRQIDGFLSDFSRIAKQNQDQLERQAYATDQALKLMQAKDKDQTRKSLEQTVENEKNQLKKEPLDKNDPTDSAIQKAIDLTPEQAQKNPETAAAIARELKRQLSELTAQQVANSNRIAELESKGTRNEDEQKELDKLKKDNDDLKKKQERVEHSLSFLAALVRLAAVYAFLSGNVEAALALWAIAGELDPGGGGGGNGGGGGGDNDIGKKDGSTSNGDGGGLPFPVYVPENTSHESQNGGGSEAEGVISHDGLAIRVSGSKVEVSDPDKGNWRELFSASGADTVKIRNGLNWRVDEGKGVLYVEYPKASNNFYRFSRDEKGPAKVQSVSIKEVLGD